MIIKKKKMDLIRADTNRCGEIDRWFIATASGSCRFKG
jgi:hypothetical protein